MTSTASPYAAILLCLAACGGPNESHPPRPRPRVPPPHVDCPTPQPAPALLPGTEAKHRTLEYWLAHTEGLDDVLLSPDAVRAHDQHLSEPRWDGKPLAWADLAAPVDADALRRDLVERLDFMRGAIAAGELVGPDGGRLSREEAAAFTLPEPLPAIEPRLHVALGTVQLRCGPRRDALFKLPIDRRFNRNNCSSVGPQELVRVILRWPSGPRFVRTRHASGWIDDDAPLSPEVPPARVDAWTHAPLAELLAPTTLVAEDGAQVELAAGTLVPTAHPDRLLFATDHGVHESTALHDGTFRETSRPLTRRAVLEEAFARLGAPYGWGGDGGGLDCSGFVLAVFASFGVQLPRDSGRQALAGTEVIEVPPERTEAERLALVDAAARRGVVLLHFPGHIMLYLGRDDRGTPMAIHAFAEYLEPCPGGGETLRTVEGVTVSDLSLGRGTSRKAFLERITRVVVLGGRS